MKKQLAIRLKNMTKADLKSVLELEQLSFNEPYSREIFEQELKVDAAILKLAFHRNKKVGYIDFWLVQDEIELISIAVHPKYRHKGVATQLMTYMFQIASENKVKQLFLDVRRSNHHAIRLYESFGFETAGVRRRYYSDNQEDALIMKRVVSENSPVLSPPPRGGRARERVTARAKTPKVKS